MSVQGPYLILAGGTGGHVFPGLAVAEALGHEGQDVVWMGTRRGLEADHVPAAGIPMEWVDVGGLRGKGAAQRLAAPWTLARAVLQAWRIVRRTRPRAVLGMGGFAAGPGGVAARLSRVPLVIHEQNAIPGLTNRWLARIAQRVLEAFPGTFSPSVGAVCTGNPVRPAIAGLAAPQKRMAGRHDPIRLLVFGGSRGARTLNEQVPKAVAGLRAAGVSLEVWHQAGGAEYEAARTAYEAAATDVRLMPFIEDMAEAYAWADLAVCRAGATTVAELAAAGLGAVLVPFPHAVDDHQTANARFLVEQDAGVLLSNAALGGGKLQEVLHGLVTDRSKLLTMACNAHALARPDAAQAVAAVCREVSHGDE